MACGLVIIYDQSIKRHQIIRPDQPPAAPLAGLGAIGTAGSAYWLVVVTLAGLARYFAGGNSNERAISSNPLHHGAVFDRRDCDAGGRLCRQ